MKSSSQRKNLTNIFGVNELPVYLFISPVRDANDITSIYMNENSPCRKSINNDVGNLLTWNVLFLFLFCIHIH